MSTVRFSARTAARSLFGAVTALILVHICLQFASYPTVDGQVVGVVERFNVDNELSIPTWFSQILLFVAALLLAVIGWHKRQSNDRFARHWYVLSAIFIYLSMDEGSTLHETVGDYVQTVAHNLPDFLYFAWVIPFAALVLIVAIGFGKFWWQLPSRERWLFAASALLYIGGALGMEMMGGAILGSGLPHAYYLMSVTIEEAFELFGIALFISTLLNYMATSGVLVNVTVEKSKKQLFLIR